MEFQLIFGHLRDHIIHFCFKLCKFPAWQKVTLTSAIHLCDCHVSLSLCHVSQTSLHPVEAAARRDTEMMFTNQCKIKTVFFIYPLPLYDRISVVQNSILRQPACNSAFDGSDCNSRTRTTFSWANCHKRAVTVAQLKETQQWIERQRADKTSAQADTL